MRQSWDETALLPSLIDKYEQHPICMITFGEKSKNKIMRILGSKWIISYQLGKNGPRYFLISGIKARFRLNLMDGYPTKYCFFLGLVSNINLKKDKIKQKQAIMHGGGGEIDFRTCRMKGSGAISDSPP